MSLTSIPASLCAPSSFDTPVLFGAQILSIQAHPVLNFTRDVSDQLYYNNPSVSLRGINYCNVTVTYTHPGQNDTLNVESWLPMDNWNGRLQAVGGGGYVAGRFPLSNTAMAGAIGQGYAASTLDAGLELSYEPEPWAQVSPGNVDLYSLQNFASVALNDQAIISKSVIQSFYGEPPAYSYWSGCSQGGRQGFMLAQRYPDAYDGIAAAAPAFNWGQFIPAAAWAQVAMNILGEFPHACELDAITDAAIEACDSLDGLVDSLVSDADACVFDPYTMVGRGILCEETGQNMTISLGAATIANLTWAGPTKADGTSLWYGPDSQARLTGAAEATGTTSDLGYAMTLCDNAKCIGVPTGLGEAWLRLFVKKDPAWDYTKISSFEEFGQLFHASVQQFDSIIGTADPDLSAFGLSGGKLLTYHGLADGLIPSRGTTDYYDRASEATPNLRNFFRYFKVPGLAHCAGGNGGQPTATFQALVDWVEKGVVPNTLPIQFNGTDNTRHNRILCPYPETARLRSNASDPTKAEAWTCSE